ncbi:putative alcohol dehydrogenase [Amniculicola lignicola CBS 123094]|uniref:Putative alcohol dehydrogenase n=1 Tax=Amniculicola lignicola CBS 123094 TaxID=1392246 RepID=A0A6A5W168_9PLEO|nr:putative alcohol dehydrogenase [Amniculicola lignicola CBS 123094]
MLTQSALVIPSPGSPLTLITDHPIPKPHATQLLLRVTVGALNPHDEKSRARGLFLNGKYPAILGMDVAGEVTAIGASVTRFKIGEHVFAQANWDDTFQQRALQEYAVVDEAFAARVSEGFTDHDGATLPTNIIAPFIALFSGDHLGIPAPWMEESKGFDYAGTTLLIIGGGSNNGRFAVQLAKWVGIGKIVVVGGGVEELIGFGATHVLDRHGGHDVVLKRIRDVVEDDLVYAFDTVNPPTGQILGVNALSSSKAGKLARLVPTGPVDDAKVQKKDAGYEMKDVWGSSHLIPEIAKPFWERIEALVKKGDIKPLRYEVIEGLSAEEANKVLDRYRDGKKVVQTHLRISN